MRVSIEEMRFKVPRVASVFFYSHRKILIVCFIVVLLICSFAITYYSVINNHSLILKDNIIFFADFENIEEVRSNCKNYDYYLNIYFAKYDDVFSYNKELNSYDLGIFSYEISDYITNHDWFKNNTLKYAITSYDMNQVRIYSYKEEIVAISTEEFKKIIESILDRYISREYQ